MSASTALASPRIGRLARQSFGAMTRPERARVMAMYGAIGGLHALGFFIFVFVLPSHYKGLGIGVSVLAYTRACGTHSTPTTSPRSTTPPARCWANVRAPVSRVRSGSVSSSPSGIPPSWSRSG